MRFFRLCGAANWINSLITGGEGRYVRSLDQWIGLPLREIKSGKRILLT